MGESDRMNWDSTSSDDSDSGEQSLPSVARNIVQVNHTGSAATATQASTRY